jgi:hypothetical protein
MQKRKEETRGIKPAQRDRTDKNRKPFDLLEQVIISKENPGETGK